MKEKAKAKEILQKIIPFLGIILMIIIFQVGGEGKLLTKGNMSIRDIAIACGFQNISYFSRQFKACTGKTPQEYSKTGV